MSEIYSRPLVIGIDAGGTRSRACLAEAGPEGAVLGCGSGGPGNALSVGRDDLTRHLTEAIGQALAQAAERAGQATAPAGGPGSPGPAGTDALRGRVAAAFGGFAGAAEGVGPERGHELALSCLRDALAAHGITGAAVGAGGDTEVALAAAPGAPADGLVLIAGTGAIASRLAARRRAAVVDGHGWLLGDEGSGFWLGGRTVRATLEALDGRGPWTSLVGRVAAHYLGAERTAGFGPSAGIEDRWEVSESIVTGAYGQAPAQLAVLSRAAVEAAGEGDEVALRLLDEAAGLLASSVRALDPRPGEPLVMTGGLLGPDGPLLSRVGPLLAPHSLRLYPVSDVTPGAAALAGLLLAGR
jgi:N-acetylglucosamine kinase-like BadF-type ATPase